jgi:subtilisin family serine protease
MRPTLAARGSRSARRPELRALLERHRLDSEGRPFPRARFRRLDQVVKLVSQELKQDPRRTREAIAELRRRPEVEYAEPNLKLQAYWSPNDPYLGSSGAWGQAFADLWGLQKIGAASAWDSSRGAGVVVAVLDTGIYFDHPDLAANLWLNAGELGLDGGGFDKRTNGVDDDANGYADDWRGWDFIGPGWGSDNDPGDEHGHGTHVAGTIAAVADNGVGIAGVAPSAQVMAVRVLDAYGSGSLDGVAAGVVYAADRGAKVLNLSLGTGVSAETPQTLRDAIAYAQDVKGALVVAAAGNAATDVGTEAFGLFPAAFRDVVAVAATDSADQPASFSNHGLALDVAAPGGGDTDATGTVVQPSRSVLSLRGRRLAQRSRKDGSR